MSNRIIQVNGDGTPKREPKLRGNDFITVNQAMNMVLNACGPIAMLAEEIKARQQALEDHIGFTYVPAPETPGSADLAPRQQTEGGDSE